MLPGKLALHLLSVYRSWRRGIVLLLAIRESLQYLPLCLYRLLDSVKFTFAPPSPGELEIQVAQKDEREMVESMREPFSAKPSSAAFLFSASSLVEPSQRRRGFMHHKFDDQLARFPRP